MQGEKDQKAAVSNLLEDMNMHRSILVGRVPSSCNANCIWMVVWLMCV